MNYRGSFDVVMAIQVANDVVRVLIVEIEYAVVVAGELVGAVV